MKLSDTEWTVMNEVWRRSPVSARDVLEAVESETEWAYTTVKTILSRLVDKGALHVRKRANTSLFQPRISREKARRSALEHVLHTFFGGSVESAVASLLEIETAELTDDARRRLKEKIDEARKEGR